MVFPDVFFREYCRLAAAFFSYARYYLIFMVALGKLVMKPGTSAIQNIFRILLGLFMLVAGIGHLTFQRQEFQAQVPDWLPLGKDLVVVLSGILEIALGLAMLFLRRYRAQAGIALAIVFILVFPGNIGQYANRINAFGLDTDQKRLIRLFFQPVLVAWALWSAGSFSWIKQQKRRKK